MEESSKYTVLTFVHQAIANLAQVNATGWSAFTMLGIAAFVAAAIVILAQLMGLMGRGQNGGGKL